MQIVYFISEENLIQRSDIINATWGKPIGNSIYQMQQAKILPRVGSDFYNKLSDLIVNGTIQDPGNEHYYTILKEFLQPMLVSYVTADLLPRLNYKISSQGVIIQKNDTGESVDLKTIQFLQEKYSNEGEWFSVQLRNYMMEYQNDIPEFRSPTTGNFTTIEPKYNIPWSERIYFKKSSRVPYRYLDGDQCNDQYNIFGQK
jgi:hypothetical protein